MITKKTADGSREILPWTKLPEIHHRSHLFQLTQKSPAPREESPFRCCFSPRQQLTDPVCVSLKKGQQNPLCFSWKGRRGRGPLQQPPPVACVFREPSAWKPSKHLLPQPLVSTANIRNIVLVKYDLCKSNLLAIFCPVTNQIHTGLTPNFSRTAGKIERKRHCALTPWTSRRWPNTSSRLTFLNSVCLCFL